MFDYTGQQIVAKFRERLAVNKQRSHRFHIERLNLETLNKVEGKENFMLRSQTGLQLGRISLLR
jgi:hypothetical protein